MTITQLNYIIAVDTHRHFARAAESCFVTQPTLSMQIHKLEEELGVTIFDRSRKPLQPTDIGVQILEQARIIITEERRIEEIIQLHKGEISGDFKLAIIPTVASTLLPRRASNEGYFRTFEKWFIRCSNISDSFKSGWNNGKATLL